VNNLPRVVTWQWNVRESNLRPRDRLSNMLTVTPSSHIVYVILRNCMYIFLLLAQYLYVLIQPFSATQNKDASFIHLYRSLCVM